MRPFEIRALIPVEKVIIKYYCVPIITRLVVHINRWHLVKEIIHEPDCKFFPRS